VNRKQMEEIARKRAPKRPHYLSIPDNDGVTGQEALMLVLDRKQSEEKQESGRRSVVLYLREGVNPADSNFTKYPNDIHLVMLDELGKEYEGILYVYLWRQSFGYGRNYCRTSYLEIMSNTLISSRKTAQRAVSSLVEKHFIVRAKHENGIPNVNQQGALYRVFTPREIQSRTTEEGLSFDDLTTDGVVCQAIPSLTIPETNSDGNNPEPRYGLSDHSQTDHPFKEESLKDSLSARDHIRFL